MSDIALDLNPISSTFGDVLVTNNSLTLVDSKAAIQQDILQRIKTFQEEWFMDVNYGVPWLQQIMVKNPDPNKVDALIINAILSTPGVTQLLEFTSNIDNSLRMLTISFKVLTTSGIVDYTGTVP